MAEGMGLTSNLLQAKLLFFLMQMGNIRSVARIMLPSALLDCIHGRRG